LTGERVKEMANVEKETTIKILKNCIRVMESTVRVSENQEHVYNANIKLLKKKITELGGKSNHG